jgi:hydrogenase maturation protein HypF
LCARRSHGIWTSSAGRLFDAFSALLRICSHSRYEGQAAIELEVAAEVKASEKLPFSLLEDSGQVVIDMLPAFAQAVELLDTRPASEIASMFHTALAEAFAEAGSRILQSRSDVEAAVPLAGGVFQNELFCAMIARELEERGIQPVFHRSVPTNDGGISLGQAVYGLLKQKEKSER